jgi:hypothetical protein
MPAQPVAVIIPLMVSVGAVVCTIAFHSAALSATVTFVRREHKLGRTGASFGTDAAIVAVAILFTLVAHLLGIGAWAVLFMLCGEFTAFGDAFNHSAVNYTTLGYGDVVMTPSWRLLGPLEAATGSLMFGVSTATIFAVIYQLVRSRLGSFED